MNVGETYKHKWNKYVAEVTSIKSGIVELKIIPLGIKEYININNFDLNYEPYISIKNYENIIRSEFTAKEVIVSTDTIKVNINSNSIDFIFGEDTVTVNYIDNKDETIFSTMQFPIEEASSAIKMVSDLFIA